MFKNKWTKVLSILLIIMMSFLVGCDEEVENIDNTKTDTNTYSEETKEILKEDEEKPIEPEKEQEDIAEAKIEVSGDLEVHYIDVGQGDSILIK